ncbi:hypothetical protein [Bacillus pseudomycoides]|uniref:hypothetical protein n=1 Tax=Bacillus pseudomycoides TaxID=64104 RepID=UPI000BF961FC|nr:hypothetical protein [Bacillus pseudomycoides]PFY91642.1 hypothetical protein COL53_11515 [Bacillus pseudomycoides]
MNELFERELLIYSPFSVSVPESIKGWILRRGTSAKVVAPKSLPEEFIKGGWKLLDLHGMF